MARRITIVVAALVIVAGLVFLSLVILSGGSPLSVTLPNPNGYDSLVAAAQKVSGDASGYATNDRAQLVLIVSNNVGALQLLRTGLTQECRVPIVYTTNYINSTLLPQMSSLKSMAFVLAAEGRLAELDGRTNDAAKIYLDGIRFGQENCRGGLVISRMVGVACEALATKRLENIAASLDAQTSRAVAAALEAIDAKEELVSETVKQDKLWGRQTGGFRDRLVMLFMAKTLQKSTDLVTAKFDANTLRRRQLILDFATRAYELDKGNRPQHAADLVPTYLKVVPKDPVTGKELVLRP